MIGEIEEINTLHFVMQSKNGDVTIYGTLLLSGGGGFDWLQKSAN